MYPRCGWYVSSGRRLTVEMVRRRTARSEPPTTLPESGSLSLLRRRLRCWPREHDFVRYLDRPGETCWRSGKPRALPHASDRQVEDDPVQETPNPRPHNTSERQVEDDAGQETFTAFWLASPRREDDAGSFLEPGRT
jgi:hypothetical protein